MNIKQTQQDAKWLRRSDIRKSYLSYLFNSLNFEILFCKSCGHEIDSDSIYCSFCGLKQQEIHKPQQADTQSAVQPINKIVELSALIAQPLEDPLGLEIRNQPIPQTESTVPNNQSLSPGNLLDDIDLIEKSLRRPETVNISIFLQAAIIIHDLVSIVLGMVTNTITGFQVFFLLFFSIWRGLLANSIFYRKRRARIIYCILASLRIVLLLFMFDLNTHVNLFSKVEYIFYSCN